MVLVSIDLDDLARLYKSGYSVNRLAQHFGTTRTPIVKRLNDMGIVQRGRSESMYLRMSQTSGKERARLASAAHDAVRGMRRTDEDLCKRAKGKEINLSHSTRSEAIVLDLLHLCGLNCTPQKAVGKYNIDIAVNEPPIAVEIFGGSWHASGKHATRYVQRTKYLLDRGWHCVFIWVSRKTPLEAGAAAYIVALAEKIRSGESLRCEEHMILGNGKPTSVGYNQLHGLPIDHSPITRNKTTGRFEPRSRK